MIIYKPKGAAREYSPLAFNPYTGCSNGCKYCYMPNILRISREEFLNVSVKKNIIEKFENDCKKLSGNCEQVLISFSSDPMNKLEFEEEITRKCLKIASYYRIPISILTKNGYPLLYMKEILSFGNNLQFGFTLTFDNSVDSNIWEPGAMDNIARLSYLKYLKMNHVKTWASIEPIIYPKQSLNMIKISIPYVDHYRIGKLNNYKGLDKKIDWNYFLKNVIDILRSNNKKFYIKESLRNAAPDVKLLPEEIDMDRYNIKSN